MIHTKIITTPWLEITRNLSAGSFALGFYLLIVMVMQGEALKSSDTAPEMKGLPVAKQQVNLKPDDKQADSGKTIVAQTDKHSNKATEKTQTKRKAIHKSKKKPVKPTETQTREATWFDVMVEFNE